MTIRTFDIGAAIPGQEEANPCDVEPIHRPGSIQPHGVLFVAEIGTLKIIAGAGDIEGRVALAWLDRPLPDILGPGIQEKLTAAPESGSIVLGPVAGLKETFDVVAHRVGRHFVVELEPAEMPFATAASVLSQIDIASAAFERATNLATLCATAASVFRQMTGFDRVMVYRFLDDEAGAVVGEARDPEIESFLNHHFPASDIPKQARALYVRNRIRAIPEVDYAPAELRPASAEIAALDLSDVALRSVSPIHIQYLKNMKVGASASISIVKDGILWGLIACHHRTVKHLPYVTRMACRSLAGSLGRQIKAKEEAEAYRERIRLRSAEDSVVAHLARNEPIDEFFAGTGDELRRMLSADGFAAVQGASLHSSGNCTSQAAIMEIAAWLRGLPPTQPFHTHNLSHRFPPAAAYREKASGLLAVTISTEVPTLLMWFRAEHIEIVNWAGNPHKAATTDPLAILTPRASFEAWSETVRGRARPWTHIEIEAANRLRRTLLDARQNRRIHDLNRDLLASIADKDTLLLQKDFLLKEVNHRVQNSLQLVSAFLGIQARGAADATLTAHIGEAQRRIAAVSLVHRRLYSDDHVGAVDLGRYLEELCAEIKNSMGGDWEGEVLLDLAPILISTDRAVNVGLILTELIINAQKYAYSGASGPISIALEQHRNLFRLIVADRGAGKTKLRQGFGTRMLKTMVDGLAGTIEETSNDPGLRIIVTAPI